MKNNRKYITTSLLLILTMTVITVFSGCQSNTGGGAAQNGGGGKSESPVNLRILCVGDIMAHSTNIKAAYDSASDTYDFSDNYQYVNWYIKDADLALCNVETTFGGGEPRGYPTFCAPDSLAAAIADAGFDVGITSNNHMMDTGGDGMQRTLQILRENGLTTVGSHLDGEPSYALTEVNGVNVGIVAYTGASSTTTSVNGIPVSESSQKLVNLFDYTQFDATGSDRIQQDISDAREAGAEIVICYLHWGEEYQREPNEHQTEIAQKVADMGADVIFASHPHVLQKIDVITSASGEDIPVFYSMGNFISNQRQETLDNHYTEQGMLAFVDLEYMKSSGEILSKKVSAVPTWVDKYSNGSSNKYAIIPLDSDIDNNATLAASGHMSRAKQALEEVRELIGDDYLNGKIITAGESDNGEDTEKAA